MTLQTQIWTLKCAPLRRDTRDLLVDQARRANAYLNKLIEGELLKRRRYREARAKLYPELVALEEQLATVSEAIAEARAELQLVKAETRGKAQLGAAKEAVKQLVSRRKELSGEAKAMRDAIAAETRPANRELEIRCSKVPELVRERHRLQDELEVAKAHRDTAASKILTAELSDIKARITRQEYGPRIKERVNAAELERMLSEPQWPELWRLDRQIASEQLAAHKKARAESGLTSGTYLLIDEQFDKMRKSASDPEFSSFARRDQARIGVGLRNLPIAAFLNGTAPSIRMVSDDRADRGSHKARTVEMRIGDAVARVPVWMSRDFPEDALIKRAWILIKRLGPTWKERPAAEVQLTITSSKFATKPCGTGTVALDLGWRVMEDGSIRVAYAADDRGHHWSIVLPAEIRKRLNKRSPLLGFADEHFNAAKSYLISWRREHPGAMPEWCDEHLETLSQWCSRNRLDAFVCRLIDEVFPNGEHKDVWGEWKRDRFCGLPSNSKQRRRLAAEHGIVVRDLFAPPTEILSWLQSNCNSDPLRQLAHYLDFWRRKNLHLSQYAAGSFRGGERSRRELYRKIARDLSAGYERVVLEQFDLTKVSKKEAPEEPDGIARRDTASRHARSDASPGLFRQTLLSAFGCKMVRGQIQGGRAVAYDAADTTRRHVLCGHVNTGSHTEHVYVFCENTSCPIYGQAYDQDRNAAENLLAMDRERLGGDEIPATARMLKTG